VHVGGRWQKRVRRACGRGGLRCGGVRGACARERGKGRGGGGRYPLSSEPADRSCHRRRLGLAATVDASSWGTKERWAENDGWGISTGGMDKEGCVVL
jgi:hypothetical protein